MRLHLCCGKNFLSGYINVDKFSFGANQVWDIEKEWPIIPGSIDEIFIQDGLEHLFDQKGFYEKAFNALRPGGIVKIIVPHYKSPSAYIYSHKHYFSYTYWLHFPEEYENLPAFKVVSIKLILVRLFGKTFYAPFFPRWWERFLGGEGIQIILKKGE